MPSIDFSVDLLKNIYTPGNIPERDIIEFGTFSGSTGKTFNELCKNHNLKFNKWWGCDSFQGLPEESSIAPKYSNWAKGVFNIMEYEPLGTIDNAMQIIKSRIDCQFIPVELIKGFFDVSLTDELAKRMKPMAFIHIDCDLYISSVQALDFLARNNLIVKDTIICYDDWGAHEEWNGGESLAHKQITEKYNLNWEYLCKPLYCPPNVNTLFKCRG